MSNLSVFVEQPDIQEKFKKVLGKNSQAFIASMVNVASNNNHLVNAEPMSIVNACMISATLGLSIDPNIGQAYIIPYGKKAQFQIGYKGLIDLCQRTGMYKTINVEPVYEGEFRGIDRLTGEIQFEWIQDNNRRKSLKQVGTVAYFELKTGFKKSLYMTYEELMAHATKYSKSYSRADSIWKTDFVGMSNKTVLKLLLGKFGIKSVELNLAIQNDQAEIEDDLSPNYTDSRQGNISNAENNERSAYENKVNFINNAKSVEQLEQVRAHIDSQGLYDIFKAKEQELLNQKS